MFRNKLTLERLALANVGRKAERALDQISKCFSDPVKVTLIVRNLVDESGERDFIVTDDTLDGVALALEHARARESTGERGTAS